MNPIFAPEQCGSHTSPVVHDTGPRIRRPDGTGNSGAILPALAVRQPWAWMIVHGGKDIENRTWFTRFRGPFLVHASACPNRTRAADEWSAAVRWVERHVGKETAAKVPPFFELQYGGIIGMAELVGCKDALSDEARSPWFEGPWGFVLRAPKAIPFTPCRGSLGFFTPVFEEAA